MICCFAPTKAEEVELDQGPVVIRPAIIDSCRWPEPVIGRSHGIDSVFSHGQQDKIYWTMSLCRAPR